MRYHLRGVVRASFLYCQRPAWAGVAGPDKRCAVLGTRSASTFAGVTGAVLARSAYVPLNPRHPCERLSHMINTAWADALVVDENSFLRAQDLLGRVQRPLIILLPDAATSPDWAVALPQHRFLCRRDLGQCNLKDIGSGESGGRRVFAVHFRQRRPRKASSYGSAMWRLI